MYRLLASLFLICMLLLNGVTSMAQRNHPKRRVAQKISERTREAQHESRKELAAKRALIKRNPRFSTLFNGEKDLD